jgi:N-acetylmuramic acid 6-phosphate etherase
VKLALLMAAAALSVDQAEALLQQHDQQLRPALDACAAQLAEA